MMWPLDAHKGVTFKVDLLSPRGRRGLRLIMLSVIVIAVSGLVYMRPIAAPEPRAALPAPSPLPLSRLEDNVSYDFVTPSMGWAIVASAAVGQQQHFSVFRTVDGAKHWQQQISSPQDFSTPVDSHPVIKFFDKSNGFAVVPGLTDLVYRTTDGGAHWRSVVLPGTRGTVISLSDPNHGWLLLPAAAEHAVNLFSTSDAGASWQRLPDPPADGCINAPVSCGQLTFASDSAQLLPALKGPLPALTPWDGIAFRGPSEGWLGSKGDGKPHVYSSVDGGSSWSRHDLPIPATGLAPGAVTSVRLLPGNGVVAFLNEGYGPDFPVTSFDGGASWRSVATPPTFGRGFIGLISFQDAFNWWDADGSTIFKSSDAGQTWSLGTNVLAGLFLCQFLDSKHVWGVFSSMTVATPTEPLPQPGQGLAVTADGGLHWTQASVPDPA
jgi:photosystem II stability/assembly factor-like uncharacterized protein